MMLMSWMMRNSKNEELIKRHNHLECHLHHKLEPTSQHTKCIEKKIQFINKADLFNFFCYRSKFYSSTIDYCKFLKTNFALKDFLLKNFVEKKK